MRVFIITEAGKEVGLGHLTRCLSIYHAFDKKGVEVELIVDGDSSFESLLKDERYQRLNWLSQNDILLNMINSSDVVIVDSYLADINFYQKLASLVESPVYVDDNKRLDYPRGTIVNISVVAEDIDYDKRNDRRYILGTKYALIRKEFWNIPPKRINNTIKSVLLVSGGSDSKNIIARILKRLNVDYPNLKKNIIIGKAFMNIEAIKKVSDQNTSLIYEPDVEAMKKNMLESDIAITAGGQTLYELACLGVPTIAIAVAENQMRNVSGWERKGFIDYAGWWQEDSLCSNVTKAIDKLKDKNIRNLRSKTGRSLVTGNGPRLLVETILEPLKVEIE